MEDILIYLLELLLIIPTVLIALTFHECAHGLVAYKLGDPTAKYMGRISLNPLRHFDIIGGLCLALCGFGWAKAVPVDMRQFRNPKRDMAITALAGPMTNLILGFIGCLAYSITLRLLPGFDSRNFAYWMAYIWVVFIYNFGWLNISLAIFNLLPLPPFDGSRILSAFLPDKYYIKLMSYERHIALGFFILLFADSRFLGGYISGALSFLVNGVFNGMMSLFNLFW